MYTCIILYIELHIGLPQFFLMSNFSLGPGTTIRAPLRSSRVPGTGPVCLPPISSNKYEGLSVSHKKWGYIYGIYGFFS